MLIYCTIAFTGFSSFFDNRMVKASMEVFSFVFMLFLGVKFLTAKTVIATTQLGDTASRIERRIDEKLHPHSAFMIGFMRVLGNVGVLLFWIVAAAYFMSHDSWFTDYEWVEDTIAAKGAFITAVALGANSWFCALSYGVSRGRGRFSEHSPAAHGALFRRLPARTGTVRWRAHRVAVGPAQTLKHPASFFLSIASC